MKARFDGTGDVIVITGGGSGIGRALATAAAGTGARVVVCDVDRAAMESLALEDPRIAPRHLDVGDRDAVFAVMAGIEQEFGQIDGLVCGAAVQPRSVIHDMDPAQWQRVLRVNLDGVVWCYQAAIGGMIARRAGSIIAFTSGLAYQGWPQASAYAASKAALIAFVKSAAKEVVAHRVRVNLVSPGVIDTPQYRQANAGRDDDHWRGTIGVGEPADVVAPLLFLLSDAATMTGSILSRDMAFSSRAG